MVLWSCPTKPNAIVLDTSDREEEEEDDEDEDEFDFDSFS